MTTIPRDQHVAALEELAARAIPAVEAAQERLLSLGVKVADDGGVLVSPPDGVVTEAWLGALGGLLAACERAAALCDRLDPEVAARSLAYLEEYGISELRAEYEEGLAELTARRRQDRIEARREEPTPPVDAICAEDGCRRVRVFFDEGGVGYCKRHGDARGLRPHGKVT